MIHAPGGFFAVAPWCAGGFSRLPARCAVRCALTPLATVVASGRSGATIIRLTELASRWRLGVRAGE